MPNIVPIVARFGAFVRLFILLGFALALGACTKCDVPDFTHWGAPPPPHACN
jgi:hypothetical protein